MLLQLNIHPIPTNIHSLQQTSIIWAIVELQISNTIKVEKKKSNVGVYTSIALIEINTIVNATLFICFILRSQYVYRFYSLHEEFEEFII